MVGPHARAPARHSSRRRAAGAAAPVPIIACPIAVTAYAAVAAAEIALINAIELKEKAEIKANQSKRLLEKAAKDLLHCEKKHGAAADDSSDANSEDYSNYDDEVNSSEEDDDGDEGDEGDEGDAGYSPSYEFTTEDLNDF